ncbi:MAG TPA: hypothetical protein VJY54_09175 [Lachnospiraceae bacterium]|nr:hypothetical protein [Lachnospiraceae bacterium]
MKTKKIFVSILVVLTCITCLTGCTQKKPVTLEEFKNVMSSAGFTIVDATDQATGDSITAISLATKEEYQIEFYVFTENKFAASAFIQNQSIFESYESGSTYSLNKEIGNYAYYSLVSDGECYILARVDNTLMYAVADATYKNDITELAQKLGY